MTQTESNQEVTKMTDKHAAEYSKDVWWGCKLICVSCRNCSYNNIAKSIGLLDKIAIFDCTGIFHTSKSFCDRRPLKSK